MGTKFIGGLSGREYEKVTKAKKEAEITKPSIIPTPLQAIYDVVAELVEDVEKKKTIYNIEDRLKPLFDCGFSDISFSAKGAMVTMRVYSLSVKYVLAKDSEGNLIRENGICTLREIIEPKEVFNKTFNITELKRNIFLNYIKYFKTENF